MTTIKVRENGPYLVSSDDIVVIDWNGQAYQLPKGQFVLCRCGGSTAKPFCDKTHRRIDFKAAEEAANTPPPSEQR